MIPGQFDYVRPGNLDETLRILKDREGEAKLLSGGYSLIPLIKLRLAQPALLVDLRDVDRPRRHRRDRRRAAHRRPRDPPPDPRERDRRATTTRCSRTSTATIGDPQVRNWGTIGGSVAHADPASDWPAVLIAAQRARSSAAARPASGRSRRATSSSTRSDRHRADRGPDRDPDPRAGRAHPAARTRSSSARSATSPRPASPRPGPARRPTARSRRPGSASPASPTRPFAATDAEAVLARQRPERRPLPPGGRRRGGAEPPGRRRPRSRRLQAGDGRGADPQGAPHRRRPRDRVRVGGQRPR